MPKLTKINIPYTSVRLNLTIVIETVLLLLLSLAVILYFSRQALLGEARRDAEQTLDGTMQHIDNVLMSVEQSSYNIYKDLQEHVDDPERMFTYSHRIVETNPFVVGCAIVFKPGYYPGHDLYMAYIHRKGSSITTDEKSEFEVLHKYTNRPYTEQIWYTEPMAKGKACWVGPLKNEYAEDEALITFCLPSYDKGECVGAVATDLSIGLLSQIILSAKSTTNGYCVLLNSKGSYIVHPDEEKLKKKTVFGQTLIDNPEAQEAASAMLSGESGYRPFHLDNKSWYVFYKPFDRDTTCGVPMEKLGWSAGMVFLEDDILGDYKVLIYLVIGITIFGLLMFFGLCRLLIRHQMKPLLMLTRSAQRIAEGYYDETVPNAQRDDEIGQLQDHFQKMQLSLAAKSEELEQLTQRLKKRGEDLRKAYGQAQGSDRMKTTFLHYMTTQMTVPADLIERSVMKLVNNYDSIRAKEADYEVGVIKKQSGVVLDLLEHMVEALQIEAEESEKEYLKGKEADDD